MRARIAATLLGLLLGGASGSACAMRPVATNQMRCTVVGAEMLPPEVGGADAVCRSMREAVSAAGGQAAASELSITVQIASAYSAAAIVTTADGRKLAEQQVAISDRKLNQNALAMLAKGVAAQLAGTR
jgi:hypothetical protein